MVKQANKQALAEITAIISDAISTNIANNKVNYDQNSSTYQMNSGSTGCNNIKSSSSSVTYMATSEVVSNSTVYQNIVATIVNQITSKQNNKSSTWFGQQGNDLVAAIMNIVKTKLTQTTIANIGDATNISNSSVQVCLDSNGGNNVFFSSENDIFQYYNQVYSTSSTVQSVAADISNMIAADQGNKATGIIALIVYAIIAIAILLVVLIGGGMLIYLMTML